ncbi:Rieske (2Fe-2S) protein [Brevibacillus parabrevis]|uniref:Rieske (2Fe-2S) protein n=1 Tax=Brevibacillus parabrevis TaxID=54914 RepID=UPI001C21EF3D|nr:Rieske 2Fe-2S domain-containing protein [Brevibacillus parabrevis]MBU8710968.1 Rieske 2Fe-2S domain-containing protein [Brevibacillus parabrevis]MDR5002087.1 Rieske 2Fe-2S domain-containing protein [Brevibacillus parabrevis]WDV92876.1 Rieske 2Fe-2S domain-containing protein [Brevibacillus parabrevis]
MQQPQSQPWINAGTLASIQEKGHKLIHGGIAVFYHEQQVYAVDNRCPHLGFPLHMGSLCDGILTCHWHHARFDVCSGGTLDPWADDVPSYAVKIENGVVWVNPHPKQANSIEKHILRLQEGLEQNLGLVIAKAVVGLVEAGVPVAKIMQVGIHFGTVYGRGWNPGLTILTAMANVLPKLDKAGTILALYQGLLHVARNSSGAAARHLLKPLPESDVPFERLTEWYRNCIEVRDTQGAERVLLTAIRQGASLEQISEMMLIAVTDHFYLDGGHTFDFHNKAFEAIDLIGEEHTEQTLTSLVRLLANPTRSEELHQWQSPVNLVAPLKEVFAQLDSLPLAAPYTNISAEDEQKMVKQLLSDEPLETVNLVTELLKSGAHPAQLAQLVALAAAERIVGFHTQNDFGDWLSVLHTFTYAHAVHERLRRSSHPLLIRAIYHGLIRIYLDRFLNIPAARRPDGSAVPAVDTTCPERLLEILDQRQQVKEAARWTAGYLHAGGNPDALLNTLGHALLREDAEFHSFQMYEAAVAEYDRWAMRSDAFATRAGETMLLAATRYLAAHAPTPREQPHMAQIAVRLHRGERLFEEA